MAFDGFRLIFLYSLGIQSYLLSFGSLVFMPS